MRIGIDARELVGHATGVGRYLSGLLAEWTRTATASGHQLVLYTPQPLPKPPAAHGATTRLVPGAGGTWWEQVTLPRAAAADALDVFFSPAYTTPLRLKTPAVVAIHDISFVAHPEWFRPREGARRRWLTARSARHARRIVTISDFTRRELVERLRLSPQRIAIIPPGVNRLAIDTSATSTRTGGVLFVGSVFNRRRLPDLIRGFAPLAHRDRSLTLDIVGDNRSYPHQDLQALIAGEDLQAQARWRSYIPDDALRALYGNARAFAFLSEYEGLGLTPLEALAAGVPVVLLDTPVARESCGDAALYVQPGDVPAITAALHALLFDDSVRARQLEAAPRVLARFDWTAAADETLRALASVAEGRFT